MRKRVKGIHDIVTPLHRENATHVPKVWSFSAKPGVGRTYQRSIERTLLIERVEEPRTDLLQKVDNLVIMAQLPDVKKEDIHLEIEGDILSIFARDRSRSKKYMKEMLLPFIVDEDRIQTKYRDGIFEMALSKRKETTK